jgi:DNA modification methylase
MESPNQFNTVHQLMIGDARRMSAVADGSVNLVLTSPPYPMIGLWDGIFSTQDPLVARALQEERGPEAFDLIHRNILSPVWREAWRVLADGGFMCVNIGDAVRTMDGNFRLYPNGPRILDDCHQIGFDILPQIIWRKPTNSPNKFMGSGVLPAGAYVTLEHEHILVMRKGRKRDFSRDEDKALRLRSALFWEERNVWFSDLWDFRGAGQSFATESEAKESVEGLPEEAVDDGSHRPIPQLLPRDRSAAFPVELAERLILMYSMQGDWVLDPFLGTGTTTLTAIGTGRNSIGLEAEPELVAYSLRRAGKEVPTLNQRVANRLARHQKWLEDWQAKHKPPLEHRNRPYQCPVMTGQEETLELFYVSALRQDVDSAGLTCLNVTHHAYRPG